MMKSYQEKYFGKTEIINLKFRLEIQASEIYVTPQKAWTSLGFMIPPLSLSLCAITHIHYTHIYTHNKTFTRKDMYRHKVSTMRRSL